MKLHVTLTSPYARIARAAIIEHGLQDAIEVVVARTREAGSPYYRMVPSGRVPVLERDDGSTLEESDIIVAYLDQIGNGPPLSRAMDLDNWSYGRLHGLARSLVDGIAVWGRELRRPRDDQSDTIIAHEAARAGRLADVWEREIDHALMAGALNLAQLTLVSALDAAVHYTGTGLTVDRPRLGHWRATLVERPSLAATRPPPKLPPRQPTST